jgi:protein associated with RNAse G/E
MIHNNMINILVLGDSHTRVFKYCNSKQNNIYFDHNEVCGATAIGMTNISSITNTLNIFTQKILTIDENIYNYVLIMIGEVDCGCTIWIKKMKYNIDIDEQINKCVENLLTFIENVVLSKFKPEQIILIGSILPTIKDSTDPKYLNGYRKDVDISQIIRTEKTLQYNFLLKEKANKLNYKYIDITNDIIGDNGIINEYYLSEIQYDHHLSNEKTYKLWINRINSI